MRVQPTARTEDRWLQLATALTRGDDLPPIEVMKIGKAYFVRDAHQRVSVARAFGVKYIDARVTVIDSIN